MKKNNHLMGWALAIFFAGALAGSFLSSGAPISFIESQAAAQYGSDASRTRVATERIATALERIQRRPCP